MQNTPKLLSYAFTGIMEYEQSYHIQHELNDRCKAGEIGDTIIFTEHPHVYTLGRQSKMTDILIGEDEQRRLGVQIFSSDRGGQTTYHGPGQLVVYPIWNMQHMKFTVRSYVQFLETLISDCLLSYGIKSHTIKGEPGVYVIAKKNRRVAKVASIGVRVSGGVTLHGFALNVSTDLGYINNIIPCGSYGMPGASIHTESVYRPTLLDVSVRIKDLIAKKLDCHLSEVSVDELCNTDSV